MASHPLPPAAAPAEPLQLPPARGHIPGGVTAPPGWWLSLPQPQCTQWTKTALGKLSHGLVWPRGCSVQEIQPKWMSAFHDTAECSQIFSQHKNPVKTTT